MWPSLIFDCLTPYLIIVIVIPPFPNSLATQLVLITGLLIASFFASIWIFYRVAPLVDKKISKSG